MKRFLLISFVGLALAAHAADTRIMMVGNSITEGVRSSDLLGFRRYLFDSLTVLGYPFDFVGGEGSTPFEGFFYRGALIEEFFRQPGSEGNHDIAGNMDYYQPHVLLVHLGTNDMDGPDPIGPYSEDGGATFTPTVSGQLAHFLSYLMQWRDGTRGAALERVFLSRIIDRYDQAERVLSFNGQVEEIVRDAEAGHSTLPAGCLRLVDHHSGFDASLMSSDGIHPNDWGYYRMAGVYFDALRFLPMHLTLVSDTTMTGVADAPMYEPVTVRVSDDRGNGIGDFEVAFEVVDGDAAMIGPGRVRTDSAGFAHGWIRLGGVGPSTVAARGERLIDSLVTVRIRSERGFEIVVGTEPEGLRFEVDGLPYDSTTVFRWPEFSTHRLFVDTLQADSATTRHAFARWNDGGEASRAYTVGDSPDSLTAYFATAHYVYVSVDPDTGGTVLPPPPGYWAGASDTSVLTAVGNADGGYRFSRWSGDGTGHSNPLPLEIDAPKRITAHFEEGDVRLKSDPPGLIVVADEDQELTPFVPAWKSGELHRLGTFSPQGDSLSTLHTFSAWEDGKEQWHEVRIPEAAPVTYRAIFDVWHYLEVVSEYGTPEGGGLWARGEEVRLSVDSLVQDATNRRWRFAGWRGSGAGAVTSGERTIHVRMEGPMIQEALWEPQYLLEIATIPPVTPGASVVVDPPGFWYGEGEGVVLEAVIQDTECVFLGWEWEEGASVENPLTLVVDGPLEVTARFDTPNEPPRIVNANPISILEDEVFVRPFDWVHRMIEDANDPLHDLDVRFRSGSRVSVILDSVREEIRIVPQENWFGEEFLELSVSDPYRMTDVDTLLVFVASVNDPPGAFALVRPPNDTTFAPGNPVVFGWERSRNVDPGDGIAYEFRFGPSSSLGGSGTVVVKGVSDTSLVTILREAGTFYWGVWAQDGAGVRVRCDSIFSFFVPAGTAVEPGLLPEQYTLLPNYPNPFNAQTAIRFGLPEPGDVRLLVLDIRGRRIRVLRDERFEAGYHEAVWDGRGDGGRAMPSGVYILRLETARFADQRKMLLLE